jgi:hypothetical protein
MSEKIYSFISSDPDNFGTVVGAVTETDSEMIEYYVSDINFQNFMITTTDDYIIVRHEGILFYKEDKRINFPDKSDYTDDSLIPFLNNLFTSLFTVEKLDDGKLKIHTISGTSYIKEMSHRVRMLLGLMNYRLNPTYEVNHFCTETPNISMGNLMYLNSIEAGKSLMMKNHEGSTINSSIMYVINQFMKPFIPTIVKNKHKQMIKRMSSNSLRKMTFQLTDKYNVPIVLKSPLLVSIIVCTYRKNSLNTRRQIIHSEHYWFLMILLGLRC